MSTVAYEPPPTSSSTNPTTELPPLWPRGVQIPFIGLSGEFGTGKTLFGLLIDPPRCIHFDFEKSAQTYESGLPFTRVDMPDAMLRKFPNGRYKPIDLFVVWREMLAAMPRGKYRVVVIDDVSALEDGLAEYVRKNPGEFGYSPAQFSKSEAMMWGVGKSFYKQLMLTAGIECCVMVAHMRMQFAGGRPTGKREAKGKETVMELASLYLMLDRRPDEKGRVPEKPNAVKLKDRLSVFVLNAETGEYEPHPVLPPRIVGCSPGRIRAYILNPPDYAKLKKDELALAEQLSDDEKLLLQSQMASDQKEAAIAQAANQAGVNEAAKIRLQVMQAAPGAKASDQSADVAKATEEKAAAATTVSDNGQAPDPGAPGLDTSEVPEIPMVTIVQLTAMRDLKEQLKIPNDQWKAAMRKRGVESAQNLTFDQADKLVADLMTRARQTSQSAELSDWANRQAVGRGASAEPAPFATPGNPGQT